MRAAGSAGLRAGLVVVEMALSLVLLIGAGLQALVLTLFTVVDSLVALYLTSALFGFAFGGIVPAYAVILREHFPLRGLGTRIAVVYMFGLVGMSLGGWLGG